MDAVFNSRDEFFRSPFGAVEEQTSVHFKIVLPRSLHCCAATLIINDDSGNSTIRNSMFWCGMKDDNDNYEMWECDYTPNEMGLYWYHFEIITSFGTKEIFKCHHNSTGYIQEGDSWQLTVYKKGFKTPDWLAGGIIYQIFPDRFFNSQTPKNDIPKDRIIQDDWYAQPDWRPNMYGKVTNSEYFCGDLNGITQKLDYIKSLGVTCIYLNPIFEAHSNHRYNTADYSSIDPILGTIDDFHSLCNQAEKRNIRIILDGVFSHTGSDSIYFNKYNRYESIGAFNSKSSPYFGWYNFIDWPNRYHSWWGFNSLPEVDEQNPSYNEYINGDNGIVRKWLKEGASGWRLDVADELPDIFLQNLRVSSKKEKEDSLVIGEVWEDASNKESYGHRRKFILGNQLDSVMNYPFRSAVLGFFTGENGHLIMERILTIVENYPPQVLRLLMNPIGTHDTERAITVLAGEPIYDRSKEWQANTRLNDDNYKRGVKLLKAAAAMQYTLPGVPSIYYGDEAGLQGYKDPLNRYGYPWGKENSELIEWYKQLGELRKHCKSLIDGKFVPLLCEERLIAYIRKSETEELLCVINLSGQERYIVLPDSWKNFTTKLSSKTDGRVLIVPHEECAIAVNYNSDKM